MSTRKIFPVWKMMFPKATNFNRIRTRRSTLGHVRKKIREERKPIKNSNLPIPSFTNQERERNEKYKEQIKNITDRITSLISKPRSNTLKKIKLGVIKERKAQNKGRSQTQTYQKINADIFNSSTKKENTIQEVEHKLNKLRQKIELFKQIEALKERKNPVSDLEKLYVMKSEDTLRKLNEEMDRLTKKRIHLSEYQENRPRGHPDSEYGSTF